MGTFLMVIVMAVLVNNFVVVQFLGICPFLGLSKKTSSSIGMGIAVIFVIFSASLITYALYYLVLEPFHIEFMKLITFILGIASLVQFVEMVIKKFSPTLYKALGIYLPLITTNCAVLGVTINNISDGYGFIESMVSSLGCGLGFLLAMWLFAGVRGRIEMSNPPKPFQGVPIALISASIVSISFYGFAGIIEKLFA